MSKRTSEWLCRLSLAAALILGVPACENSRLVMAECSSDLDCSEGMVCQSGHCQPVPVFSADSDRSEGPDRDQATADDADHVPDGDTDRPGTDPDVPDGDLDGEPPDDSESIGPDSDPPVGADLDLEPMPELAAETEAEVEYGIPPGNDCSGAVSLAVGRPVWGTTLGTTNAVDPGAVCTGTPLPGADVIYKLVLTAGDGLKVTVVPGTAGYNPAIYLIDPCEAAPPSCLAQADRGRADEEDQFTFQAGQSGVYYLVVDSIFKEGIPGGSGIFTIAAMPYPTSDICRPCGPGDASDCGPNAGCVIVPAQPEPVEYFCAPACENDEGCPKGFACHNRTLADSSPEVGRYCVPKYGENQRHTYATCAAILDMGTPCVRFPFIDNDAACGADDETRTIDDAVCTFFPELTDLVSYCTIYCMDDTECPEGYFCYPVPGTYDPEAKGARKVCKIEN